MSRMTDERLAYLEQVIPANVAINGEANNGWSTELLQALKAEREEVKQWKDIYETMYNRSCEKGLEDMHHIAELEAEHKKLRDDFAALLSRDTDNLKRLIDAQKRLDAVNDTLKEIANSGIHVHSGWGWIAEMAQQALEQEDE